jgi:hypothetical protein
MSGGNSAGAANGANGGNCGQLITAGSAYIYSISMTGGNGGTTSGLRGSTGTYLCYGGLTASSLTMSDGTVGFTLASAAVYFYVAGAITLKTLTGAARTTYKIQCMAENSVIMKVYSGSGGNSVAGLYFYNSAGITADQSTLAVGRIYTCYWNSGTSQWYYYAGTAM